MKFHHNILGCHSFIQSIDKRIDFCSGDVDMLSVVHVALKYGWKVEIWSYEKALHNDYRKEQQIRGGLLSIHFIDEIFDRITFQKFEWTLSLRKVPRERSLICKYVYRLLFLGFV